MNIKQRWRRWLFRRRIGSIRAWSYIQASQIVTTGCTRVRAIKSSDDAPVSKALAIGKQQIEVANSINKVFKDGALEIEQIVNGQSWWKL